jgi:hypothetical protein
MTRPAFRLSAAIDEAIHTHAYHYSNGKVDLEKALAALGEVASDLLANIRDQQQCNEHRRALINGITVATASKRLAQEAIGNPVQQ